MTTSTSRWLLVILGVVSALVAFGADGAKPGELEAPESKAPESAATESKAGEAKPQPVTMEVAKDRARFAHQVFSTTLDVMHEHYFHPNKAVLPARAMEDVFSEVARQSHVEAKWIAVNTKAMSVHHEPETDFEKQAAKEIATGKEAVETVDAGFYRRATAIPLTAGCVGCHAGLFAAQGKTQRFAGLVVSIPVAPGE